MTIPPQHLSVCLYDNRRNEAISIYAQQETMSTYPVEHVVNACRAPDDDTGTMYCSRQVTTQHEHGDLKSSRIEFFVAGHVEYCFIDQQQILLPLRWMPNEPYRDDCYLTDGDEESAI